MMKENNFKSKRLIYWLLSTVNVIGVFFMVFIGLVAILQKPVLVFQQLENIMSVVFWVFISYWIIAMILNTQTKNDKQYKEMKELRELYKNE